MKNPDRLELAKKRILSVTGRHGIISLRTLEHKIADGGPYNQRVNPHVITNAKKALTNEGEIVEILSEGMNWYYVKGTPDEIRARRLLELSTLHKEATSDKISKRIGQSLEIAVQRGLIASNTTFLGNFIGIDDRDDSILYTKEEPPSSLNGRTIEGKSKFEFIIQNGLWAGVEIKNIRPWLYPDSPEIKSLISKSLDLNIVPVLIARRIPYVTNMLLRTCGGITWETLRQRYPETAHDLADRVRDKLTLGYSDITIGNNLDNPLLTFISEILPRTLPEQFERFQQYADLLKAFSKNSMPYNEFAARVRRRRQDRNENDDFDFINF